MRDRNDSCIDPTVLYSFLRLQDFIIHVHVQAGIRQSKITHAQLNLPFLTDVLKEIPALAMCHDEAEAVFMVEELFIRYNMGVPEKTG